MTDDVVQRHYMRLAKETRAGKPEELMDVYDTIGS
jgi:hypothetical protein